MCRNSELIDYLMRINMSEASGEDWAAIQNFLEDTAQGFTYHTRTGEKIPFEFETEPIQIEIEEQPDPELDTLSWEYAWEQFRIGIKESLAKITHKEYNAVKQLVEEQDTILEEIRNVYDAQF